MTRTWLLTMALAIGLSGCTADPAQDAPDLPEEAAPAEDSFLSQTTVHSSTLVAAFRLTNPLGQPVEQAIDQEPLMATLPPNADGVLFELVVAPPAEPLRPDVSLRMISASDAYRYASGDATEAKPIRHYIEQAEPSYDVTPVADIAAVDLDYTVYVTFVEGTLPEGWSALSQ